MNTKCEKCSSIDICILKNGDRIEYFCPSHMDEHHADKTGGVIFHTTDCFLNTLHRIDTELDYILGTDSRNN